MRFGSVVAHLLPERVHVSTLVPTLTVRIETPYWLKTPHVTTVQANRLDMCLRLQLLLLRLHLVIERRSGLLSQLVGCRILGRFSVWGVLSMYSFVSWRWLCTCSLLDTRKGLWRTQWVVFLGVPAKISVTGALFASVNGLCVLSLPPMLQLWRFHDIVSAGSNEAMKDA